MDSEKDFDLQTLYSVLCIVQVLLNTIMIMMNKMKLGKCIWILGQQTFSVLCIVH